MSVRACIIGVAGETLRPEEARFLNEMQPWGVILMGRNCISRSQVKALVDQIWQALERTCLIFIDQEGGRVARLKAPEWPEFPSAGQYGALYAKHPEAGLEAAWLGHRLIGHELASLSIHANCAPALDRYVEGASNVIGDRAFSDTPDAIIALGRAALSGLNEAGVAGVIKHMPGHGRALIDSHEGLPHLTVSREDLADDIACFSALSGASMGMSAHIAYHAFDPDRPATLSPIVISDVIRGRIGFNGLLMTDDLGMKALADDLGERAAKAIEAGCDIALHCAGFVKDPSEILAEMRQIAEAVPILTGQSLDRARQAENLPQSSKDFDIEAGYARLEALMMLSGDYV